MTRPLSYARHKNSRRVLLTIVTTWIISASVSAPILLGINYTARRQEHPSLCTFYNADFLIYSSMASFYVPCFIMIVLYWRIFRAIRRRERKNKSSAPSSASSAAVARRLSCIGGGTTTTLPPPPGQQQQQQPESVPQPRPPRPPEQEVTVDRPDGCSSLVVDVPRSPPPAADDVDGGKKDAAGDEPGEVERRQPALPIFLMPSGESPRNDDSFECEGDRVLAMLPTPYDPSTKVRRFYRYS